MAATRLLRLCAVLALLAGVPACTRHCVPQSLSRSRDLTDLSLPPGAHAPVGTSALREVEEDFKQRAAAATPPGARPYHFLALSGGGLYGSFGVGVLNGWTASGARPTFDVV